MERASQMVRNKTKDLNALVFYPAIVKFQLEISINLNKHIGAKPFNDFI
jgi:hypothetical protein